MKHTLYIILIIFSSTMLKAQTFEWLQTPYIDLTLNPALVGYSTVTDPDGNVYFLGYRSNAYAYNDIMGNVSYYKYSSNGEIVFFKIFTGRVASYNMVSDSEGNIIVALSYLNTLNIDDLSLSVTNQEEQHLLIKFSPEGTMLWHEELNVSDSSMPGFNLVSEFRSLAVDAFNNVYAGYGTFIDSYITKYSAAGNEIFTITQGNVARVTSIDIDTEGNIYAAGSCLNYEGSFGGTAISSTLPYNTYIVKYDTTGGYQWSKLVEDITCSSPNVAVNTPDEIYFSSMLYGSYAFDAIIAEGPTNFNADFFLAKLNSAGQYQWVRDVPGSGEITLGKRKFLTVDSAGNAYVAGTSRFTIEWNTTVTTTTLGSTNKGIIVKYNPQGIVTMAKVVGGEGYYSIFDTVSIAAGNNEIYLTGMGYGNNVFDSFETGNNEMDFTFITKLSQEGLATNHPVAQNNIVLYPNPATTVLNINGLDHNKNCTIINMLGQQINSFILQPTEKLNIEHLPVGIYYLKIDNTVFKFQKINH